MEIVLLMARNGNDAFLVFDKDGFAFLFLAAAIYRSEEEKEINGIRFSEGRFFYSIDVNGYEEVPSSLFDNVIEKESLSLDAIIDLLNETITLGNVAVFKDFLDSLPIEIKEINPLYKYVSNISDHFHYLFENRISFSHRDYFDDIYDSDIKDDVFFLNEKLKDKLRILCLSQRNDIAPLWGLYANKFQGFCFQYDSKDIFNSIRKNYKKKDVLLVCQDEVSYGPIPTKVIPFFFDQTIKDAFIKIRKEVTKCFYKHASWKFEQEYRYVVLGNFNNKDYLIMPLKYKSFYYYDTNKVCGPILFDRKKLDSMGVWFFLTSLYSLKIKPNEKRYKNRDDHPRWFNQVKNIDKNKKFLAIKYLEYLEYSLKKDTKNDGNVTLAEQKLFIKELLEIYKK